MILFFRLFCLISAFFGPVYLLAQAQVNFDSLQSAIDHYPTEDTVKARMLINFSNDIRRSDQGKGIAAAEQGLGIAQRLGQPILQGDALVCKGLNLFNKGNQLEGIAFMEQAFQIYDNQHHDLKSARVALRIGELSYYIAEFNKMKEYCQKAEKGFKKLGDQGGLAMTYNSLGVACLQLSDNDNAFIYLNKAQAINLTLKDTSGLYGNYDNYGVLYSNLSNYPKSLEYFQKSLALHEQLGARGNPANAYSNISGVYFYMNDFSKSLEYDQKALLLFEKSQNQLGIGMSYVNMAIKFSKLGDIPKALAYNQKGKSILEPIRAQQFLSICLSNIASLYEEMPDYEQAFKYYKEALDMMETMGIGIDKARVKINIGNIIQKAPDDALLKMGIAPKDRRQEAEKYTLEGIQVAREIGSLEYEQLGQKVLSYIYEEHSDYVKSLKAFQLYVTLKDSISSEDIRQEITRKEIQYEFDKKETVLKFEQQLTEEQLAQQKLLTIQQQQSLRLNEQALSLSNKEKDIQRLAYLQEKAEKQEKEQLLRLAEKDKLLQDAHLGNLLQEKALQLKTLAQKNALIGFLFAGLAAIILGFAAFYWWLQQKQVKKEAAVQAKFTRQLLENIEDDRGRIATDLHDSVSHDLLLLKQSVRKEITGPEVGSKIDNIIHEIRQISRNLHPVMLDKIGLSLSLETLCEQFMQHETMFVSHDINYQNTLPKPAELQLFRIVQEGLTNALKYSKAEAVKVLLAHSHNELRLEIQDNGKGFDVKKALDSGKAFGLHSIVQRAKAIGGTADIQSDKGGTTISVLIGA